MATNTAKGFPYPVGTDRVMDGDDAIRALAEAVDTKLGVAAAGSATLSIAATGTAVSATVTFPAGRFTAVPHMFGNFEINAPQNFSPVSFTAITATGATLWVTRVAGGNTGILCHWLAIQNP